MQVHPGDHAPGFNTAGFHQVFGVRKASFDARNISGGDELFRQVGKTLGLPVDGNDLVFHEKIILILHRAWRMPFRKAITCRSTSVCAANLILRLAVPKKKPIVLIGFFHFDTIYWILYSSSFRYSVAIPISSNRAASALLPLV